MARITGPLMSLDASGTIGHTVVFSKWKGQNYSRLRVIPQNPQSPDQVATRGALGVIAKAARAVLTVFQDTPPNLGSQFFIDSVANAPAGQSWISWLQQAMHDQIASDLTTYTGLSGTITGYYDDGADTAGLFSYTGAGPGGTTYSKGFQVYLLAHFAVQYLDYAGFAGGIDTANATEVNNFVDYLQDSVAP